MNRRPLGFTLIELLVAIVMIGAMLSLAFPRVRDGIAKEALRGARRTVTTQIAQAKGVAAARGCLAVLHLSGGGSAQSWVTTCNPAGGMDTIGNVEALAAKHGLTQMTSSLDSIIFAPTGIALSGAWAQLRFSRAGFTDTLAISPVGRPQW